MFFPKLNNHILAILQLVSSISFIFLMYNCFFLVAAWRVHHSSTSRKYPDVSDISCHLFNTHLHSPLAQSLSLSLGTFIMYTTYSHLFVLFSFNQDLRFGAAQLKIKESSATVTLVSRRCTRRLGIVLLCSMTLIAICLTTR